MYRTYLLNFGYDTYVGPSIEEAVYAAKKACFEAVIYLDDNIVMSFSPISGVKNVGDQE